MATPSSSATTPRWKTSAALLLIVAALALFARTYLGATRQESVLALPELARFPDQAEHDRRLRDVIGTFATGKEAGERVITVLPNGTVRFALLGPLERTLLETDSYHLALHHNRIAIATSESGLIEVLGLDRLAYCGDEYRRTTGG
ncbi:hypothetical protein [Opitutus sp. ER46]|uniref:hypothetical protein n=1 Tax=Opitutus sp. ER46 TaxID=2161864 RepID=UPI000D2F8BC7|nr:hypothetical protein [Opitutus sp. ER46]PTY00321.1 hypothetical protein DB354_01535 [Opitutus sp. ER46]